MTPGPYYAARDHATKQFYLYRPDGTRTIFGKRSIAEHAARECNKAYELGRSVQQTPSTK